MYDLCNLAVVNIKDIKNSFKLLAFPDTRVFQAPNTGLKVSYFQCIYNKIIIFFFFQNEWLTKFEIAKKSQNSVENKTKNVVEHKIIQRTDSIQLVHNCKKCN